MYQQDDEPGGRPARMLAIVGAFLVASILLIAFWLKFANVWQ